MVSVGAGLPHPHPAVWRANKTATEVTGVYDYLAQGHWFRHTTPQGQFSLGCLRYNVGVEFENQMLEITFDPQTCELVCLTENGRREIRLAAQGLTKSDLMGELHRLTTQSPYQLALPFARTECRQMILSDSLSEP